MLRAKKLRVLWLVGVALFASQGEAAAFQLGKRPADEWVRLLERDGRVARLKIEAVISRLDLKPGEVVADIGAGSGVFSRPLAQAVAPTGMVLAVEIDQALLDHIDERSKQDGINNIRTVLGQFDNPSLPTREVDLAFLHDALHHIEHREVYLRALVSYLKPEGRIVVIDLIKDHPDSPHKNQPAMQITLHQVKQWMEKVGFHLTANFDLFDEKFFAVFARNPLVHGALTGDGEQAVSRASTIREPHARARARREKHIARF